MTLYYSLVSTSLQHVTFHFVRYVLIRAIGVPPPRFRNGLVHDLDHPHALHLEEEAL